MPEQFTSLEPVPVLPPASVQGWGLPYQPRHRKVFSSSTGPQHEGANTLREFKWDVLLSPLAGLAVSETWLGEGLVLISALCPPAVYGARSYLSAPHSQPSPSCLAFIRNCTT